MEKITKKYIIFFSIGIIFSAIIFAFVFLKEDKNISESYDRTEIYTWAYNAWITSIPDINNANMDWPVYRKSAAKMMSQFAMNIFWRVPDTQKSCKFIDIKNEDPELQWYIVRSCQLGIMWVDYYGNPETIFNPNYVLTADQLVTILSRILFGNTYNIKPGELTFSDKIKNFFVHSLLNIGEWLGITIHIHSNLDRYTKHMDAIKKLGIITKYEPDTKEFRWYVMMIMHTLDMMGMDKIDKLTVTKY